MAIKYPDRVKVAFRKKNGHIATCSNDALKLATGEYCGLLDHDDVLWPNALFEVVKALNIDKSIDFIYTDEDKLIAPGVHAHTFFKPKYNSYFLMSCNYITHFAVIRKGIMAKVGGFRQGTEGAQDWDLFLRISDITGNIVHIPKILYSWRSIVSSTASYRILCETLRL